MTNYNERLDGILNSLANKVEWCVTPETLSGATIDHEREADAINQAKQAIIDWHNKQIEQAYSDGFQKASKGAFKSQQAAKREAIEEVLDRLEDENTIFKDYKYEDGVLIGTEIVCEGIPLSAIEAERNKLKGSKNDQL